MSNKPEEPLSLPQSGGTWIRQPDNSLVKQPEATETPPEAEALSDASPKPRKDK